MGREYGIKKTKINSEFYLEMLRCNFLACYKAICKGTVHNVILMHFMMETEDNKETFFSLMSTASLSCHLSLSSEIELYKRENEDVHILIMAVI